MGNIFYNNKITRRSALTGLGALATLPLLPRIAHARSDSPIRIGMQLHRTGIGASYGRWYQRVTDATVRLINENGGINGRPVEVIYEDDGTDPRRGVEVVEKFATVHKVDLIYGTLFSHVVTACAPRVKELKIPYVVVSEGYHIASGKMNRWCFQPGITDVRQQVSSIAPWITQNLGKKITMIYPDYAFGYDHRDFLPPAIENAGGQIVEKIAIPPTETSFMRYLPRIPSQTDVLYHVMVGPSIYSFVSQMGEFFGSSGPQLFGFIDSLESIDLNNPRLDYLRGSHFWEGMPRYAQADQPESVTFYREQLGLDDNGALKSAPDEISSNGHMFGCWETLYFIKQAMELCDYQSNDHANRVKFIEAMESIEGGEQDAMRPQGDKIYDPRNHQVFGPQYISHYEQDRLNVVHQTTPQDGFYEINSDYRTEAL